MDNFQRFFVCEGLILGSNKDVIELLAACDNISSSSIGIYYSVTTPENFSPIKQLVNLTIDLVFRLSPSEAVFVLYVLNS